MKMKIFLLRVFIKYVFFLNFESVQEKEKEIKKINEKIRLEKENLEMDYSRTIESLANKYQK